MHFFGVTAPRFAGLRHKERVSSMGKPKMLHLDECCGTCANPFANSSTPAVSRFIIAYSFLSNFAKCVVS